MELFFISLPILLFLFGLFALGIYEEYNLTKVKQARIQLEIEQLKLRRAELESQNE